MKHLSAFAVGLLMAIGLAISGMTDAQKVIDFLALGPDWDPALALVMGGAIGTHLLLWRVVTGSATPLYAEAFLIPTRSDIDLRLVGGSALFGVGWALGGFCPGPAMTSLVTGATPVLVFVASMAAGMLLFHVANTALTKPVPNPERSSA